MGTGPAQRQSYGPGGHVPHGHRILQQEVRWRPPKHRNRLPRGLVQVGDALATREAYPDSPMALGTRNAELPGGWSLLTTPSPKLHDARSTRARAEGLGRVWAGVPSSRGVSNACQAPRTETVGLIGLGLGMQC